MGRHAQGSGAQRAMDTSLLEPGVDLFHEHDWWQGPSAGRVHHTQPLIIAHCHGRKISGVIDTYKVAQRTCWWANQANCARSFSYPAYVSLQRRLGAIRTERHNLPQRRREHRQRDGVRSAAPVELGRPWHEVGRVAVAPHGTQVIPRRVVRAKPPALVLLQRLGPLLPLRRHLREPLVGHEGW